MFGKRLKSLRLNKKLTQAEMAEKIGVARTTYAMYEQNKREPDNEILLRIADYFNVTTDYLLGRSDIPSYDKKENEEFQSFVISDPSLRKWYLNLPNEEDDLKKLREVWEIIKREKS